MAVDLEIHSEPVYQNLFHSVVHCKLSFDKEMRDAFRPPRPHPLPRGAKELTEKVVSSWFIRRRRFQACVAFVTVNSMAMIG